MFLLCDDSALRLAYKQLSFSRYAYDGEDQCLSPDDVLATGCVAQPSLRATIVASFPGVFPRERIYIARGALDERTRSGLMLVA